LRFAGDADAGQHHQEPSRHHEKDEQRQQMSGAWMVSPGREQARRSRHKYFRNRIYESLFTLRCFKAPNGQRRGQQTHSFALGSASSINQKI